MPLVIANPRGQQDGSTRTQFTDTTNTTSVTYTYPTAQSSLIIENSGERDIFVTVGSVTNQQIQVDKKWKYDGSFTSFSIRSDVNSQEFIATAIYDDSINTQLADIKKLKNTIICIGDSTMAGTPSFSRNISQWLSFKLRKPITNKGVWGDTLQGVYNRLDTDVIALKPKICVVLVGTNNINNLESLSSLANQVKLITNKLADNAIKPVWCSVFPRTDKPELMPAIRQYNYWLFNYCNENNISFADTFSSIANPDGTPKANMLVSTDNLHLNCQATVNAANAILGVLPVEKALMNWRFGQTDNDEFFQNCNFALDSNADGTADGWAHMGTASTEGVWTLEDNTRTAGSKWQVISKPTTVDSKSAGITAQITGKFIVGKKYRIEHDVICTTTDLTTFDGMTSYIYFLDSGNAMLGSYLYIIPSAICDNLDSRAFLDVVVPTGAVKCSFYSFAVGKSDFILKISNLNIYEKLEI